MKKLLALVLALVMALGLFTVGTNAATKFPDDSDITDTYEEAVRVMNELKVLIGNEEGKYLPKQLLDRQSAATIVSRLDLGVDTADALQALGTKFVDVPRTHWAAGYIEYLASAGISAGDGTGKYLPANDLTTIQFAKMLLVVLGYNAETERLVGDDWAINTSKLANQVGLLKSLEDVKPNDTLNREQAAQMAFNAIQSTMVEYDSSINLLVGNQNVSLANSNAKPVTNEILTRQTISYKRVNARENYDGAFTVEFAEQKYPKLVKTYDTDEFGRPSHTWTYNNEKVGQYVDWELLKAEYTKTQKGKALYADLGWEAIKIVGKYSENVANYYASVYVDGLEYTYAQYSAALTDRITKNNDDDIKPYTGKGVLTQIFVDDNYFNDRHYYSSQQNTRITDMGQITFAVINTYLGIASADYNTTTKVLPLNYYVDATTYNVTSTGSSRNVAMRVESDDVPSVVNFKKDDPLKVWRYYDPKNSSSTSPADLYKIYNVEKADVISKVVVTDYKDGTKQTNDRFYRLDSITANGSKYEAAEKCFYDVDLLYNYNSDRQQLKDSTYDVYLDDWGYMIGLKEVDSKDQYIFVVGYQPASTSLAKAIDSALIIDTDGEMKTVSIKDDDVKVWNNSTKKYSDTDANGFKAGSSYFENNFKRDEDSKGYPAVNRWFTYTMDGSVYKLEHEERDQGIDAVAEQVNVADVSGTYASFATHNPYTDTGKSVTLGVYGNADSKYFAVDAKDEVDKLGSITGVNGVTVGIKNTNIDVKKNLTTLTNFIIQNETTNTSTINVKKQFRGNNIYPAANAFFIYNNDGYVKYAVVVGEDAGSSANFVYFTKEATMRSYDKAVDGYNVTYKVIMNGELKDMKVKDGVATDTNPLRCQLFKSTVDKNGWISGLKGGTEASGYATDNTPLEDTWPMNTSKNKDRGYTQTTALSKTPADGIELTLKGNTLWVYDKVHEDNYVVIDDNCNVFVRLAGGNNNNFNKYDSVESAINSLTKDKSVGYVYEVATVCDKGTGYATTLIIYEEKTSSTSTTTSASVPSATVNTNFNTITANYVYSSNLNTLYSVVQDALKNAGYTISSWDSLANQDNVNTQTTFRVIAYANGSSYPATFTVNANKYFTITVDGAVKQTVPMNSQFTSVTQKSISGNGQGYTITTNPTVDGVNGYYEYSDSTALVTTARNTNVTITTGLYRVYDENSTSPVVVRDANGNARNTVTSNVEYFYPVPGTSSSDSNVNRYFQIVDNANARTIYATSVKAEWLMLSNSVSGWFVRIPARVYNNNILLKEIYPVTINGNTVGDVSGLYTGSIKANTLQRGAGTGMMITANWGNGVERRYFDYAANMGSESESLWSELYRITNQYVDVDTEDPTYFMFTQPITIETGYTALLVFDENDNLQDYAFVKSGYETKLYPGMDRGDGSTFTYTFNDNVVYGAYAWKNYTDIDYYNNPLAGDYSGIVLDSLTVLDRSSGSVTIPSNVTGSGDVVMVEEWFTSANQK